VVSISLPLRAEAVEYYVKYYQKLLKAAGTWFGEAVSMFCLHLRVKDEEFRRLFLGFHPRFGNPIVQNAGHPDRQSAWDITFSAPKSVSVLWSLLPRKQRRIIERIHTEALKDALKLLQEEAGFTRRGKGGKRIERASLLFALFRDFASRALDPQLHTHVLLFNAAMREDGTTGTIRTEELFKLKIALGECYRNSFEERLSKFIDLVREEGEFAFRVIGLPESLCKELSKRRNEIEAELKKLGKFDAVTASEVTLRTRKAAKDASLDVLFEEWKRVGEAHGFGPKEALALFNRKNMRAKSSAEMDVKERTQKTEVENQTNTLPEVAIAPAPLQLRLREQDQNAHKECPGKTPPSKLQQAVPWTAKFIWDQLYHIRVRKFTAFIYPTWRFWEFWEPRRKKTINLRSIALGPKIQRWGFIRKRLFIGRYFELRVQERILFPEASLLGRLNLRFPALRLHLFDAEARRAEKLRKRRMAWMKVEPIPERFFQSAEKEKAPWEFDRVPGGDCSPTFERLRREEAERQNREKQTQARS
jgi:conjugative relaxase-like TrwC/TraI family protein